MLISYKIIVNNIHLLSLIYLSNSKNKMYGKKIKMTWVFASNNCEF